jgi:enterochelin esterase-like enzyme
MKRIITIVFTVAALLFSLSITAQKSKIAEYTVKSEILGGAEKVFSVYLPAGYDESGKRYPVLYLLHGAGGYHKTWIEKGDVKRITDFTIAEGLALPMIIVMPDARGEGTEKAPYAGKNMGYFNMPGWNYEDFFFQEFIPHIDATFRTIADKKHRAISGLSMGGGGSAVYALHHPEYFSSSCPLSGLLGVPYTKAEADAIANRYDSSFINSAYENPPVDIVRDATPELLDAIRTVRWYVDCGDDDYLYYGNIMFYHLMVQSKVPIQFRMRDGAHNWMYWKTALPTVLSFVSIGFAE